MSAKNLKLKVIYLAVASVLVTPQVAFADGKVVTTEKIEVISTTPVPSLGVPISQVPSNVQSVKGQDIQHQSNLGLSDFMANNLLGVNVNETQNNPFQSDVNFHGFTASPLLGTPQGLSVYQDGVRVNEPFGDSVNWDLIPSNAIANVALMPGSNPLFGLNTLGGALSVQTKSGDTNPGGSVQAYAGSWNRHAVEAEYGGKLANGAHYFFSGNVFDEDGWRDQSDSEVRQMFAKVGWKGEKDDFSLSLSGADNELRGNGLAPQVFLDSFGYESVYTQPDITENKLVFLTGQYNHWFTDDIAFNSVAYYRNIRTRTFNADANDDFAVVGDPEGVINRGKSRQNGYGVSGQLNVTTDKNNLVVGLGYDRASIDYIQTSQEFTTFSASRGVGGDLEDIEDEVDLTGHTHTWSLFATNTFSLTPEFALTTSGRYNRTRVENRDHLIASGLGSLTGQQTFHRFNPAVGLTYTPSSSWNFYGGYNEGSRAPSSIEIACSDPASPCNLPNSMAGDPPTLQQVVAKTWEGGIRGKLSESVKWSAGLYHTLNYNDIQFIVAPGNTSAGFFDNVGKTKRVGLDFGINGKLDSLSWSLGYSYVRATFESEFNIANEANSAAIDTDGDLNVDSIHVSKGDRLPSIPAHQLKLRGEFNITPDWSVGSNVVAFSNQYARGDENNQDENGKIGGYTVVNLDTRYSFGNSGWQLFAKAINIFDREYYTGGLVAENSFTEAGVFDPANADENTRFLAPGAPRAAWIGVRYEFGGKKSSAVDVD